MISQQIVDRINLLMQQGRLKEARTFCETLLSDNPDNAFVQYCYALILFQSGETDQSRNLTNKLLGDNPEDGDVINLSIAIDIEDKNFNTAISKAELLMDLYPENPDPFLAFAQIKMAQRSYDKALEAINKALELDPENIDALNFKISIDGMMNNADTTKDIEAALELQAEHPSTIANHAMQLLRQGEVDASLERFKYALSIDPNNMLAQHGMQEALKSRFWPYRAFFKFKQFAAQLASRGSWTLIIGAYLFYLALRYVGRVFPEFGPFVMPLAYALLACFYLTWILDPLMNLYLLTNKYGKHLLNKNEKNASYLVGASLLLCIISLVVFLSTDSHKFGTLSAVFLLSMIPFSSFLSPTNESTRKKLVITMSTLFVLGIISVLLGVGPFVIIFFISVFIYQFVINGILIKENARVFED